MKTFLRLGLATALMLPLAIIPPGVFAGPQNSNMQQPAQQQQKTDTEGGKTFHGTIVEENGVLILQDTIAKARYQLDDQDKARRFEGKQVKITGTLELNTNLIHVNEIRPIS